MPIGYKKLSYRRGTARCVVSIEILPIATQKCNHSILIGVLELSFFLFLFFVTSFSYKFFTNCSLHSADMSFGFLLILLSIHLVKIKFSNIPRKECISVGSLWTSYIINATRNENNISFHIAETSLVECYSNHLLTRISI